MPYLRVANVFFDYIDLDDVQTIGVQQGEIEKTLLEKGDVLFVEGNGSPDQIGRVAVWEGQSAPMLHQNHIIKARPDKRKVLPRYCMYFFMTQAGRNQILSSAKTTSGLYTLSLSKIAGFMLPLAPLEEQQQFLQLVEQSDKSKYESEENSINLTDTQKRRLKYRQGDAKMEKKEYDRKGKEAQPVLAICYDFDKTLSPDDMQAQGYIQSVGYDVSDFWKESNGIAEENDMDQNLAYMFMMKRESEGRIVFTRQTLEDYGAKVSLFPGVDTWFERIREYGKSKGVIVEHYIISSGLKEMIEGTSVAKAGAFEKVYASSFYYNSRGVAQWPAQVVNYTNKTQFLFRIEKGVLDVNDSGVNDYFPPDEIRVPFRNMIYIGDSATDIPCMKLVNSYGGHSIGVFNAETKEKSKVYQMIRDNRIKYFAPADYTENSELDQLVKAIIDRTVTNEKLETISFGCKRETAVEDARSNQEERKKLERILALESSCSFANTHAAIKELLEYTTWRSEEAEMLFAIALKNSQVKCILTDLDVAAFYRRLIEKVSVKSENAKAVQAIIDEQQ